MTTKALRWLPLMIAVGIAGCGNAEFTKAEDRVKTFLRDPDSATFRDLRKVAGGVCGEYNAKNGMGGYEGYRLFKWARETDYVVSVDEAGSIIRLDDPSAQMLQIPMESFCEPE